MAADSSLVRQCYTVRGIVQGVGFRPHVHQLATALGLAGYVVNTAEGVVIEVEGPADRVRSFATAVVERAPSMAVVDSFGCQDIEVLGTAGFEIRTSVGGPAATSVSPDLATCAACRNEVEDAGDRRFHYAFTNCTNCGPRYTIVTTIPYDRPNTTMAGFAMCDACRAEYEDPGDRRFHAQPVCCPACGPRLDGTIDDAAAALRQGEILAVKGLGGYHLAALASSEDAVGRLRTRKHREDKPFAVMAADVAAVSRVAVLDEAAERLLTSPARPIVLLARRAAAPLAASIAPGLGEVGVMLPYTPLHHLLLAAVGEAIVLTSGNVSDEPIAYTDADARTRLGSVADRFLSHDRPIETRVEDSVARVVDGVPYLLRRSRGFAPAPLLVPWPAPVPVLACGAELKSTVALARGRHVFLSQHIGDLKNYEAYRSFREAIDHMSRLFEITPALVAHDLHPDYLSTACARELAEERGIDAVAVQHHHAHIASCLADNETDGPVIGVAFDGTGYGTDGTVWGGEFLVADRCDFERAGWLAPVPLPGGDAAAQEPWRMAASYLSVLGEDGTGSIARWGEVVAMMRAGVNSPPTSSVGRLFDAVSALIGVRSMVNYEGQAAVELEALVDAGHDEAYAVRIEGPALVGADLAAGALADHRAGVDPGVIAARFHHGLARGVVAMCEQVRDRTDIGTVALSGGVFANVVLLRDVTRGLDAAGFVVLRHHRVPCNDGGISFGQAVVAAARAARAQPRAEPARRSISS